MGVALEQFLGPLSHPGVSRSVPVDFFIVVVVGILSNIAMLVVLALGLAVIFGMMGVINLAQGEFLMLGAYALLLYTRLGVNIWVGMVFAALTVGIIGVMIERAVIRFLYGRMLDTMLATWGLSLSLVGGITLIFGPTTEGIGTPLGHFGVGDYTITGYRIFLIGAAAGLLLLTYLIFYRTQYGMIARATMQNPTMAAALGVNPSLVYLGTFGLGAAQAGLAGAIMAPLIGVVPTMGLSFVAKIFITVVVGGPTILAGTTSAGVSLGVIETAVSYASTPLLGEVALLALAILVLRVLPQGITGFWRRGV